VTEGAVDAELVLSGLRRLCVARQRILVVGARQEDQKHEADRPRFSQHEVPFVEVAEFYAMLMNLDRWKSGDDEILPGVMAGGYLPPALLGLYTEILCSSCRSMDEGTVFSLGT